MMVPEHSVKSQQWARAAVPFNLPYPLYHERDLVLHGYVSVAIRAHAFKSRSLPCFK